MDIYPTFASLAGVALPGNITRDGVDITPLILGAGAFGGEMAEAREQGLDWRQAAERRLGLRQARLAGGSSSSSVASFAENDVVLDSAAELLGSMPVPIPGSALKAEAHEAVPDRKPFMYYRGQHLLAARGVGNMSAFKAHFGTHSGFGHEPYVWHDPPVIFNVELDPAERSPITDRHDVVMALTQAAADHNATLVRGAPMLNDVDFHAMDCSGLTEKQSGCC